jgi:hypothetical protein
MERDTCECTENRTGLRCPARASWLVGVGSRVSDRQLACGRHLHRICRAMLGADLPHHVTLTITPAKLKAPRNATALRVRKSKGALVAEKKTKRRRRLIAAGVIAAIAAAGVGVIAANKANAAAPDATATTQLHARADSGFGGNTWANDALKRISTVTETGPDATLTDCGASAAACFTYTGTISDTGTAFAITGATSPGALAVPIAGTPSAAVAGSATVTFHSSSSAPDASLVPASLAGAGNAEQSTTNWVEQFFPGGTTFGAGPNLPKWSWDYHDTRNCQHWVDAYNVSQADSGDITGADNCVTSVAPVGNQTVVVGTPASVQVVGSTTSSDQALSYTAAGLPDGLTVSPSTGLISGTPQADAASGTASVTVKDFGGVAASTTIHYGVQAAPTVTSVILSHGHVVAGTLNNTRAEVAWTATPAAASYRVVINGPNFNFRTNVVHVTQAFYAGLASGHTYTVYITALDIHGNQVSATGHVTFVTTHVPAA